jgi:hypothetical protein
VCPVLVALIQRDNLAGLGKDIDLFKDRYALAFDRITHNSWITTLMGINQHRVRLCEAVMQILGPHKP